MRNISQPKLRSVPLHVPSLAQQQEVVAEVSERLAEAELRLAEVAAICEAADDLARSLFSHAVTGRLCEVTDRATTAAAIPSDEWHVPTDERALR